jgi:hypothetical protein
VGAAGPLEFRRQAVGSLQAPRRAKNANSGTRPASSIGKDSRNSRQPRELFEPALTGRGRMATAKQKSAARRNVKKAAKAARNKTARRGHEEIEKRKKKEEVIPLTVRPH